ncbi:28S ribosomal protein S18b, mitochondrial [Takifugu flavidus]|uniref:28S ribosomal protein S18b, mitochondrial n=1 Tax=Takifugu flavidus TaxID=433684 RepID=UPI002544859C|nr:28S ribosomal protein S18b, mitochondrial [Takifugu flavidus]
MAASIKSRLGLIVRLANSVLKPPQSYLLGPQRLHTGCPRWAPIIPPNKGSDNAASVQDEGGAEVLSPYKDRPWDYLTSEEYIERYGAMPVWTSYRRNHKGGIPPQKTRKTCIRGDKICGNPCPICRDRNIVIHHQNVKLLQQFISPQSGIVYDPTRTGVCMKQQKKLTEAISTARNHGLLLFHIPFVEFSGEDYSNSHDAVGLTASLQPPASPYYSWYGEIIPDEAEVAKVKKTYKAYLKR